MPHTIDFNCNGVDIHIAHASEKFIGKAEFTGWGPGVLACNYGDRNITKERLDEDINRTIKESDLFLNGTSELTDGVYIFGHSHVQWNYKFEQKEVYLINPGSCGLPLDAVNDSVPYTILEISEAGNVKVDKRRIAFNKAKYVEELRKSNQYKEAYVWSEVIIKELMTAKEHLTFFLEYVEEYAKEIGDSQRPYTVETWEQAYRKWKKS